MCLYATCSRNNALLVSECLPWFAFVKVPSLGAVVEYMDSQAEYHRGIIVKHIDEKSDSILVDMKTHQRRLVSMTINTVSHNSQLLGTSRAAVCELLLIASHICCIVSQTTAVNHPRTTRACSQDRGNGQIR